MLLFVDRGKVFNFNYDISQILGLSISSDWERKT